MSETMKNNLQQKLDEGRQYRRAGVFETRAEDDGKKIVEGYATTFNSPYLLYSSPGYEVWEQIDKNAFDKCDMSDVIMQYDHAGRVFARVSNKTLEVKTDTKGLHCVADLGGTALGTQVFEEIKGGYTDKMSFGFKVETDKREVEENNETGFIRVLRTITAISKLYDVSAVSLPANDGTSIAARSYGEGVVAELTEERRQRKIQKLRILSLI